MDIRSIIDGLNGVVKGASAVVGPLAALGVPYAGLVKAGLDVAKNLSDRISEGQIVATTEDHDEVKAIITNLQTVNDRLNAEIEAS